MLKASLLSAVLKIISLLMLTLCLLTGWLFYEFYLKWFSVFENGRYFDPEMEVVYHDTSFIWGVISSFLLLVSIVLWLLATKIKGRSRSL
jgi:hypothetical protein